MPGSLEGIPVFQIDLLLLLAVFMEKSLLFPPQSGRVYSCVLPIE
jgi:hypothetical protein